MPDIYSYYHSPEGNLDFLPNENRRNTRLLRLSIFFVAVILSPMLLFIAPLYLRHKVFIDTSIYVTYSDVIQTDDEMSSVFCQARTFKMNTSFNAYQLIVGSADKYYTKQFTLRKTVSLAKNDFSSWEFYLTERSDVVLSICSRNIDALTIMTVKDETYKNRPISKTAVSNRTIEDFRSMREQRVVIRRFSYSKNDRVSVLKPDDVKRRQLHNESNVFRNPDDNVRKTVRYWRSLKYFKRPQNDNDNDNRKNKNKKTCVRLEHRITEDGRYCYVLQNGPTVQNTTASLTFDITRPIYDYSHVCLEKTSCVFPLSFLSASKIIVDVSSVTSDKDQTLSPVEDLTSSYDDRDLTLSSKLLSSCEPRVTIYAICPLILMIVLFFCALL